MSEPILSIKNLNYSYPDSNEVLFQDFSLDLYKHETMAIVGRSGCGKSTLLKLIFGILTPLHGQIHHLAKRAVYISQEEALIPWKTVLNNVLLPFKLSGQHITTEIIQAACDILADVGLDTKAHKPAGELSGGMRKRLELARALLQNPDFLLMDEPFSSLDVFTREQIILLCKKLQKDRGFSLIFVTHNPEEAVFLGSRVIVLGEHPIRVIYEQEFAEKLSRDLFSLEPQEENTTRVIHSVLVSGGKESAVTNDVVRKNHSSSWLRHISNYMIMILSIAALLGLLSLAKTTLQWPDYLFPYPKDVLWLFLLTMKDLRILQDIAATITVSLYGFFLAFVITIPLGYAIAYSKKVAKLVLPPVIVFNTLPIIALAPFFLLWFGLTIFTKILITLLIIFFPLLLITRQAFTLARQQTTIHRSNFPSSLLRIFIYLEWPYALPTLFAGWRTALSGSIIGAVVSEFFLGSVGLGSLINLAKARFDTTLMFVGLIWLAILGLSYFLLIQCIEKPFITQKASS